MNLKKALKAWRLGRLYGMGRKKRVRMFWKYFWQ